MQLAILAALPSPEGVVADTELREALEYALLDVSGCLVCWNAGTSWG